MAHFENDITLIPSFKISRDMSKTVKGGKNVISIFSHKNVTILRNWNFILPHIQNFGKIIVITNCYWIKYVGMTNLEEFIAKVSKISQKSKFDFWKMWHFLVKISMSYFSSWIRNKINIIFKMGHEQQHFSLLWCQNDLYYQNDNKNISSQRSPCTYHTYQLVRAMNVMNVTSGWKY